MSFRIGLYNPLGLGRAITLPTAYSGLTGWWRSDTVVLATGVQQMTDLSGNGRHMVQNTTTLQPALLANNVNGQNAVDLDGVDDFLQTSAVMSTMINANAYTAFAVWKADIISSNNATSYRNDAVYSDNDSDFGLYLSSTGPTAYADHWTGSDAKATLTAATGAWKITTHSYNGTSINFKMLPDGTTSSTAAANDSILTFPLNIGKNYPTVQEYFDGKIAELIIYNVDLTATQKDEIEYYLRQRYAI